MELTKEKIKSFEMLIDDIIKSPENWDLVKRKSSPGYSWEDSACVLKSTICNNVFPKCNFTCDLGIHYTDYPIEMNNKKYWVDMEIKQKEIKRIVSFSISESRFLSISKIFSKKREENIEKENAIITDFLDVLEVNRLQYFHD